MGTSLLSELPQLGQSPRPWSPLRCIPYTGPPGQELPRLLWFPFDLPLELVPEAPEEKPQGRA